MPLKSTNRGNQYDKLAQRITEDARGPDATSPLSGANHVSESEPTPDSTTFIADDGSGYEGFALGLSGLGGPDFIVSSNQAAPDFSGRFSRIS